MTIAEEFRAFINEDKIKGIKIKQYEIIFQAAIEFLKNKFNIDKEIMLTFKKVSKFNKLEAGSIDLIKMKNGKYEITLYDSSLIYNIGMLFHEYTHFKQFLKKELYMSENYIIWKNKEYISISVYNKIMDEMDIQTYNKLPWEVEALKNQNEFMSDFKESKYFKDLFEISDDKLKFILDNL